MWVDDEPRNNENAIKALQTQGMEVIMCKTTREAIDEIKKAPFDLIITDQFRLEDGQKKDKAGYELMDQLKLVRQNVPVILSTAYPNKEEAHVRGFYGAANNQVDIFKLATKAIQGA